MSFLDAIVGALAQQGNAPGGEQGGGQNAVPGLLASVLGQQPGALQGLLAHFDQAGLGNVAQSWVGTGQNQPISPDVLHGVLGSELVQNLSAKTGLPVDQLLAQAAQHLPGIVDQLTPNGQIPQGQSLLATGLGLLSRMRGG